MVYVWPSEIINTAAARPRTSSTPWCGCALMPPLSETGTSPEKELNRKAPVPPDLQCTFVPGKLSAFIKTAKKHFVFIWKTVIWGMEKCVQDGHELPHIRPSDS